MSLRISLVSMPFSAIEMPSIALTQLRSVTRGAYASQVDVRIHYLNHDFGRLLGPDVYAYIASSNAAHVTGLGEWLFRCVAFPDCTDNKSAYLSRYGAHFGAEMLKLYEQSIEPLRLKLADRLDELIDRHSLLEADIVGLTSMFAQNLPSIALARRLRRRNHGQLIVMGGANCEGTMGIELMANSRAFDFVFSGHGLVSFPKFVGHVLRGETSHCHEIDGVFSETNCVSISERVSTVSEVDWSTLKPNAELKGIKAYGAELDINTPIELDYDDFFESLRREVPHAESKAIIPFETSRGCWWGERAHCTFCGLNGTSMAYRAMRPPAAVRQLEELFARYGAIAKAFHSVDNILPREYVSGVFSVLKVPEDVSLFYEVKADIDEEAVRALARARVLRIQPGIESLATSTLKLMRKGTTAFQNIRLLKLCRTYGISPEWNLLMGFPGEGAGVYAEYKRILPTLYHLPPPAGAFTIRFDRFSPYFTEAPRFGLQLAPYDFYQFCYPFPAAALMNMAYYFEDMNANAQYAVDASLWLSDIRQLVARWKQRWGEGEPRLELPRDSAGAKRVLDTRTGARQFHMLSATESRLIDMLGGVVIEERLPGEYGEALNTLRTKGLLFSERGRVTTVACGP